MPETYDGVDPARWAGLKDMDRYNIKHILSLFALIDIPQSYMDVGCGTGIMVRTARALGVKAFGVDQLVDESYGEGFFHANLVNFFSLPEPVDLVTSFEVAEHLHESSHATYCDTLCENLKEDAGKHIVFCAARPGQDGIGHVACRPAEYWHQQFIMRGLSYNGHLTMNLALVWCNIDSGLNYMWDNLMVFTR